MTDSESGMRERLSKALGSTSAKKADGSKKTSANATSTSNSSKGASQSRGSKISTTSGGVGNGGGVSSSNNDNSKYASRGGARASSSNNDNSKYASQGGARTSSSNNNSKFASQGGTRASSSSNNNSSRAATTGRSKYMSQGVGGVGGGKSKMSPMGAGGGKNASSSASKKSPPKGGGVPGSSSSKMSTMGAAGGKNASSDGGGGASKDASKAVGASLPAPAPDNNILRPKNSTFWLALTVVLLLVLTMAAVIVWALLTTQDTCSVSVNKRECPFGAVVCMKDTCSYSTTWQNIEFRRVMLEAHNSYRANFKTKDTHKRCVNMIKLLWSGELEIVALHWLQHVCLKKQLTPPSAHCMVTQSFDSVDTNYGKAQGPFKTSGNISMATWSASRFDITESMISSYKSSKSDAFLRIISAKTYAIGCAAIQVVGVGKVDKFVLCTYAPAGNHIGNAVCELGSKPRCPKGTVAHDHICEIQNEAVLRKTLKVRGAG